MSRRNNSPKSSPVCKSLSQMLGHSKIVSSVHKTMSHVCFGDQPVLNRCPTTGTGCVVTDSREQAKPSLPARPQAKVAALDGGCHIPREPGFWLPQRRPTGVTTWRRTRTERDSHFSPGWQGGQPAASGPELEPEVSSGAWAHRRGCDGRLCPSGKEAPCYISIQSAPEKTLFPRGMGRDPVCRRPGARRQVPLLFPHPAWGLEDSCGPAAPPLWTSAVSPGEAPRPRSSTDHADGYGAPVDPPLCFFSIGPPRPPAGATCPCPLPSRLSLAGPRHFPNTLVCFLRCGVNLVNVWMKVRINK